MGIYYISCSECKKTFAWFSGNTFDQRCVDCAKNNPIMKIINNPMNTIQVLKLHPDAKLPTRNLPSDGGLDLFALNDVFIPVGTTAKIETGVAIKVPIGSFGKIFDRSSMALKGLVVGAGVVDAGYAGDCSVVLHNVNNSSHGEHKFGNFIFGTEGYQIRKGDKIAQIVIQPCNLDAVVEVTELWQSERGNLGWGSSGG